MKNNEFYVELEKVAKGSANKYRYAMKCYKQSNHLAQSLGQRLQAESSVIDTLVASFTWEKSPQGHDYWEDVYNKLRIEAKI